MKQSFLELFNLFLLSVLRLSSILLLIVFGFYSFTFKTHYCYHHDGTRFHGNCGEYVQEAKKNGNSPNSSIHEKKYVCYNVQLDKQYQQDYSFKSFDDTLFVFPTPVELRLVTFPSQKNSIPLFSCRGGPPLITRSLRGPPLC